MRKDIDDLRRTTDQLRLARPSTPEADDLQRREAALIAKIRSGAARPTKAEFVSARRGRRGCPPARWAPGDGGRVAGGAIDSVRLLAGLRTVLSCVRRDVDRLADVDCLAIRAAARQRLKAVPSPSMGSPAPRYDGNVASAKADQQGLGLSCSDVARSWPGRARRATGRRVERWASLIPECSIADRHTESRCRSTPFRSGRSSAPFGPGLRRLPHFRSIVTRAFNVMLPFASASSGCSLAATRTLLSIRPE